MYVNVYKQYKCHNSVPLHLMLNKYINSSHPCPWPDIPSLSGSRCAS